MPIVAFRVGAPVTPDTMPAWIWLEPLSATMTIDDLERCFDNPEGKNAPALFMEHRDEIERCVRLLVASMRTRPDEPMRIAADDILRAGSRAGYRTA